MGCVLDITFDTICVEMTRNIPISTLRVSLCCYVRTCTRGCCYIMEESVMMLLCDSLLIKESTHILSSCYLLILARGHLCSSVKVDSKVLYYR